VGENFAAGAGYQNRLHVVAGLQSFGDSPSRSRFARVSRFSSSARLMVTVAMGASMSRTISLL
jgi:hypothetical protein